VYSGVQWRNQQRHYFQAVTHDGECPCTVVKTVLMAFVKLGSRVQIPEAAFLKPACYNSLRVFSSADSDPFSPQFPLNSPLFGGRWRTMAESAAVHLIQPAGQLLAGAGDEMRVRSEDHLDAVADPLRDVDHRLPPGQQLADVGVPESVKFPVGDF